MLFDKEHYGKKISVELSEILKAHTSEKDVTEVSEKTGVSTSTIHYVKRRSNNLTEENSVAILELCQIAFQNAGQRKREAIGAEEALKPIIDKISA